MKTIIARAAAAAGPLTVLVLPKCPLCVMPLLAAAGIAAPAGPLLDGVSVAIVVGFTTTLLRGSCARSVRPIIIGGAALLIAGRLMPSAAATWLGVGAMVVVAALRIRAASRETCARECDRG